jgi:hypothetical protein
MKKIIRFIFISSVYILCLNNASAVEKESCYSCHNRETPVIVGLWTSSAHAIAQVDCVECHGEEYNADHTSDHKRIEVKARVCARCHDKAARGHFAGKHGIGFRAGQACTRNEKRTDEIAKGCKDCHEKGSLTPRQDAECSRFLTQSPEMQRQGCLMCHKIENRCDACHSAHSTDLSIVKNPAICKTCHMGPDHPQYEMWESSKHGILYKQKGKKYSPDCTTCHMPGGTHNVSVGITMGLAGQKYPEEIRKKEREKMLGICSGCHSKSFAEQNLSDGDAIQRQSRALLEEADNIIHDLNNQGLLLPSPSERPAHPLSGKRLDLGPQMLYEDLSRVEALYFRMKKFYYVISYKGVFHQNPDYAHWYGNAPLKLTLSEIRSEAELLKEIKILRDRIENLSRMGLSDSDASVHNNDPLKSGLRKLKELHLKGELSQPEYDLQRKALLEKHGL